ncbi:type II toxin-antitoxin system VapC family toxin [Sphingobacterium hungaricum]|uniref:PIN domain nuclease n=1 Tax=Sphingobacterium hungaricum TaxID=2082723 RepID=A0A928YQG0_9SPHI|nr:type II toxin-antitoxin system VapC family toxin [Sphingobacterium hungaricum]MBE8713924.1 PIN domain nuclease [Sphingobacterium hungaricum]
MEQYLIDTNVVSDYLSASLPSLGMVFLDVVIDAVPNLSIITQIELLCWNTDKITSQNVHNFIVDSVVLDITPGVITQCVVLRKEKKIKLPDAIIAATAMVNNLIFN